VTERTRLPQRRFSTSLGKAIDLICAEEQG
jgi:hypothetical protein